MPLATSALLDCLERKLGGERRQGSHLFLLFHDDDGTFLTKAMVSHGRSEVGDRELALVARNLGIPGPALRDCAACTLGREQLLPALRTKAGR